MKQWYILHIKSGYEHKVKETLEYKIRKENMEDCLSDILVPTEEVAEIRGGQKKVSKRKFFPGYILVNMEMTDAMWYLVRSVPGVSGFIGSDKPVPLPEDEVKDIIDVMESKKDKLKPKVEFEKGEGVKVIEGPFANFNGNIEDIYPDRGKLKVLITIFGRSTPVEFEYWQVEKI
jgi:transcriptional antiterminator NusG